MALFHHNSFACAEEKMRKTNILTISSLIGLLALIALGQAGDSAEDRPTRDRKL